MRGADSYYRKRTAALQKDIDRKKARQAVIQDYDFVVTPTCPPSTAVTVQQGKAWRNASYWFVIGYNVEKPAVVVELTEEKIVKSDGTPLDLSFTSPNYYKAVIFMYNLDWIFYEQYGIEYVDNECVFYHRLANTEYATAGEAEAVIDLVMNGGLCDGLGLYYWYALPLCGLVLRNNGTTGADGQISPVDKLNRGRSYLYRDLRPNKNWIMG